MFQIVNNKNVNIKMNDTMKTIDQKDLENND